MRGAGETHRRDVVLNRQSAVGQEVGEGARCRGRVEPQETALMRVDMRRDDGDGVFVTSCDHRPDHMSSPEGARQRIGGRLTVPVQNARARRSEQSA